MRELSQTLLVIVLASLVAAASPAYANEDSVAPFEVGLLVTALSDYRFRGVSYSNGKPAIQPMLTVSHKSGIYALVFASNIAEYGGSNVEVDAGFGYSKQIGKVTADVSLLGYIYPGGTNTNFVEIFSSLSMPVGPGSAKLNASYSPKQKNLGDQDNLYVGMSGTLPLASTPFTLNASIGLENGAFGDNKVDWTFGVDVPVKGFTAGIKYMDTAHSNGIPQSGAKAVFSLSRAF
jgi:uncharacterized protein (TIGR02001 family)